MDIAPYLVPALGLALLVALMSLTVFVVLRRERAKLSASYQVGLEQMQKRLNAQDDLLRMMTDYYPGAMTIFDRNNEYWFVNQHAAQNLGADMKDVIGKSPVKLLGREAAKKLEDRLGEVRASEKPIDAMEQMVDRDGHVRFMQIHIEAIPSFGEFTGGVLLREEDLTSLLVEREKRENMLKQVIETLVAVIDRRDPYAAGHSARVGQLARGIAEEMLLDEKEIEAAHIAGALMNFGKVLVPREILTKTSPLTPEELQRVRESILTSADILSIIDFIGPVVPTLRQALERFDGSGVPNGLKGDQILVTARIVAAANAYVALVSSRAHRPRMELDGALEQMKRDGGKAFDPQVVEALGHYVANQAAKLDWLTRTKQA